MSVSLKQQRQWLSTDELELVEKTMQPLLESLSDSDLSDLRKLVRDRRDRSQQIAARQRRELRGKSGPRGTQPATDDTGSRRKSDLLAAAVQRVNAEASRRREKAARAALMDNAAHALRLREASLARSVRPSSGRTAGTGLRAKESERGKTRNRAKLGAISQHTKNMQAKRDGRS